MVRAMDVEALTSLGSFYPTDRKSRMVVINLGQLAPYKGTAPMSILKKGAVGVV
jgi:hypothetical protein